MLGSTKESPLLVVKPNTFAFLALLLYSDLLKILCLGFWKTALPRSPSRMIVRAALFTLCRVFIVLGK